MTIGDLRSYIFHIPNNQIDGENMQIDGHIEDSHIHLFSSTVFLSLLILVIKTNASSTNQQLTTE